MGSPSECTVQFLESNFNYSWLALPIQRFKYLPRKKHQYKRAFLEVLTGTFTFSSKGITNLNEESELLLVDLKEVLISSKTASFAVRA